MEEGKDPLVLPIILDRNLPAYVLSLKVGFGLHAVAQGGLAARGGRGQSIGPPPWCALPRCPRLSCQQRLLGYAGPSEGQIPLVLGPWPAPSALWFVVMGPTRPTVMQQCRLLAGPLLKVQPDRPTVGTVRTDTQQQNTLSRALQTFNQSMSNASKWVPGRRLRIFVGEGRKVRGGGARACRQRGGAGHAGHDRELGCAGVGRD